MYLYLAVLSTVVSVVLIREEEGIILPMYYVGHLMVPTEMRYLSLEKLVLALMVASGKLQPYFQAHPIIVYTSHPFR